MSKLELRYPFGSCPSGATLEPTDGSFYLPSCGDDEGNSGNCYWNTAITVREKPAPFEAAPLHELRFYAEQEDNMMRVLDNNA